MLEREAPSSGAEGGGQALLGLCSLSQNCSHRMVEIGRDLWKSSGPNSSMATYSQLPRTVSRWLLNTSKDGDLQPLWATRASAHSPSQ